MRRSLLPWLGRVYFDGHDIAVLVHQGPEGDLDTARATIAVERLRDPKAGAVARDDAGFAVNNNFTCLWARLFREHHPEHAELFEVRALGGRSDEAMEDHHGD